MRIDPHETSSRTPRFEKDLAAEATMEALNDALRTISIPARASRSGAPAVFIVGVPRSGTTLLAQLLCKYLEVGYVNNLIARFWANPVVGIRLSKLLLPRDSRRSISLRSSHGTTQGAEGPHEFGYFWREWLQLDSAATHCLTNEERRWVDFPGLSRTIQSMADEFGMPIVFKNPICGLQASAIEGAHPDSLFICLERRDEDVVRSILEARRDRYGTDEAWWSLKPSTFRAVVSLPTPRLQVESQVAGCGADFSREFAALARPPLIVAYEEMRRQPLEVVERVVKWISSFGYDIAAVDTVLELADPKAAGLY